MLRSNSWPVTTTNSQGCILMAVAAKRPQSITSSMISLGTGAPMYARTERRVFNTSIASMAVCPPARCWLQVAAHPSGERNQHLGNRHFNSVKGLMLYKTGPLGIIAQPPGVTLLGSGENTVVGQFPARAFGPVAAPCSESGKISSECRHPGETGGRTRAPYVRFADYTAK